MGISLISQLGMEDCDDPCQELRCICDCDLIDGLIGREVEAVVEGMSAPGTPNCSTGCTDIDGTYLLTIDGNPLSNPANCTPSPYDLLGSDCRVGIILGNAPEVDYTCDGNPGTVYITMVLACYGDNYVLIAAIGPINFGGNNHCWASTDQDQIVAFIHGQPITLNAFNGGTAASTGCSNSGATITLQLS